MNMENGFIVSLKHVYVIYDRYIALDDINLHLKRCDFLGIIGPNGGGKTTLLKTLVGLIKPSRGKILIDDKSPFKARSSIGYVPQVSTFDYQYPIDVWDVVLMGRLSKTGMFKRYNSIDKEKSADALNLVGMFFTNL